MSYTRKITIVLFVVVIIFALVVIGCSSNSKPSRKDTIIYDLHYEPQSLDPARVSDSAGNQLANAIFEGLLRQKPDGNYENAMAVDWTIEEMGRKYIFKIRNANWTNGEKISADDFVYSWKRVLNPQTQSPYAYLLYDIKNAQRYHRSEVKDVAIYAADESTLVIELEKPDPIFYKKLNHPALFPLPQERVEELGDSFFTPDNIEGNGPFLLAEHILGNKYILKKNTNYWDADSVSIEEIACLIDSKEQDTWQLFKKGQVDLTIHIPQTQLVEGLKQGKVSIRPLFANYYYQFNMSKSPLKDKKVRLALSLALDREKMAEEFLQGGQNKANGLIPYSDNRLSDNDIEEARKLLIEAGYVNSADFPELELLIDNENSHLFLANYLKDEWENKLGIKVKIIPLTWQEKITRLQAREYDLVQLGWSIDYADTTEFLDRYVFRLGQNSSGWSSTEFDELVKKAHTCTDEKERESIIEQAERILIGDMVVLPLYDYTRVFAVNGNIDGLYFPPAGAEIEFKWLKINNSN